MTKSETLSENLEKAQHAADFLSNDLRAALSEASALEGIFILDLIKGAAILEQHVKSLIEARKADGVK